MIEKNKKSQLSLEHLLMFGMVVLLVVPTVLVFSQESSERARKADVLLINELGTDIVRSVKEVNSLGENNWQTLDVTVPKSVKNITVNKSEVVISYINKDGTPTNAVFFLGSTKAYNSNTVKIFSDQDFTGGKINIEIKSVEDAAYTCIGPKGGDCFRVSCEDKDNDGFMSGLENCHDNYPNDCDDTQNLIHPLADDTCDVLFFDSNCDGGDGKDEDSDGWYDCPQSNQNRFDCNSGNDLVNPGMIDVCGDGIDDDCDGFDGSLEICDGIDNDCDGTVDEKPDNLAPEDENPWDRDGDLYTTCGTLIGVGTNFTCDPTYLTCECNDNDVSVHPEATEIINGADDDCDGFIDNECGDVNWRLCEENDGIRGDINGNDCIDQNDLWNIRGMINGTVILHECADYNQDCFIDEQDWTDINNFVPIDDYACYGNSHILNESCWLNESDPDGYYISNKGTAPVNCLPQTTYWLCGGNYTVNFGLPYKECRGPDGVKGTADDCGCSPGSCCNGQTGLCDPGSCGVGEEI